MVFCFLQQKVPYRTWSCVGFLYLCTLLLYNFPCFQMYTVSLGETHCQIYPAENKHSENERSLVIFTSEASSYVVLAPKAKVSLKAAPCPSEVHRSCKEMLFSSKNTALLPKWKSSGKLAILLCLTKAKLGKSYHCYSGPKWLPIYPSTGTLLPKGENNSTSQE